MWSSLPWLGCLTCKPQEPSWVSPHQCRFKTQPTTPDFYVGAWDLNSGPHPCVNVISEPSPSPRSPVHLSRRGRKGKIGLLSFEAQALHRLCGYQDVAIDSRDEPLFIIFIHNYCQHPARDLGVLGEKTNGENCTQLF